MNMTKEQRADLATRIESRRLSDYGTRRAAYNAARVNAATWTKAETGAEDIADYSLVAIIKTLWPETGGDWRRMSPPLGGGDASKVELEVEASNLSPNVKADILRLLAEEREQRERGSA